MKAYIHFTEEQLDQARRTDLVSFLQRQGETLKRSGSEYAWNCAGEKITVRGNLWYNQYAQAGSDAIDFVRHFYQMTFPEAVSFLLSEQGIPLPKQKEAEKENVTKKKAFALPQAYRDMRRVYAYLLKERCLSKDIVTFFVREKLLYEDADYHNVVFVGTDENGMARHAHKRGTSAAGGYKGNVEGSDARYSFHYIGSGNRLYVFEAPIDLLSFLTLYPEDWQRNSYAALCSVAVQAVLFLLGTNPQIDTVVACLDHDTAGRKGNCRIREAVKALGDYNVEVCQPVHKDWNEDLKAGNGKVPLPAVEPSDRNKSKSNRG